MVAVTPPSTGSATPVMKLASGERRNATAAATSLGSPQRFIGTRLVMVWSDPASARASTLLPPRRRADRSAQAVGNRARVRRATTMRWASVGPS